MKYTLKEFQLQKLKDFRKSLFNLKNKIHTKEDLEFKLNDLQKKYKLLIQNLLVKYEIKDDKFEKETIRENENIIEMKIGKFQLLISKKTNKILKSNFYNNLFVNHTLLSQIDLIINLQTNMICDICGEFYNQNFEEPVEIIKQSDFNIIVHKSCVE